MNAKKSTVSGSSVVPSAQSVSVPWKTITKAIVDLYPPEARCLRNKAYVQAMILAGKDWQGVLDASEEVLRQTCAHCRQLANQEQQTVA